MINEEGNPFPEISDLPIFVDTTQGRKKRDTLLETRGNFEDKHENTYWLEYRIPDGELVHRSVHVHLKYNMIADAFASEL